ncbi:hypothetical protein Cgig2_007772 [Carnegiea gigantea]|uniref:Uncharacterized protein n=1 Tax=Carnegiea gigantea TaxID=171969 RepID=A0A9Q1GGQ6_9CARY|nr:hypothetical protein Cgig2_007772 [Carnegiea gigantea]
MHQRSSSSFYNFLRKYAFHHSPKPYSFSPSKNLATIRSHTFSPSELTIPSMPTTNFSRLDQPRRSICHLRDYSGQSGQEFDKNKIVDEINLKFAEAREEIEAAMESKETVYFNEEAECARAAVKEVLDMFELLLAKLEVKEREALQRIQYHSDRGHIYN